MAPKRESTVPAQEPLSLEVAHAFGSLSGRALRDAVMFGDIAGQFLAHPVGRQMAFRHLVGREVSFASESSRVQAITACAVSGDRTVLAVCELYSDTKAQVSVYELGPLASNTPARILEELGGRDGPVGQLLAAAFSSADRANGQAEEPNSKLCLASAGPGAQLIVLDWRLNEVVGRFSLPAALDRIAFNPLDSGMISGSCSSTLDLWVLRDFPESEEVEEQPPQEDRIETKELQKLAEVAGLSEFAATFTDHAWLQPANGSLAACSEEGPVYILCCGIDLQVLEAGGEQAEDPLPYVICSIESPFGAPMVGAEVRCIRCFANGFVVGGGGGAVGVWQLQSSIDDEQADLDMEDDGSAPVYLHECTARVACGNGSAVTCLDLVGDRDEAYVVAGFENSNITHFVLGELRGANAGDLADTPLISGGFHSGPVTSMDMAVQRPILVSACGEDSTVRVWDYQTGQCELCWKAPEAPTSVAIHPFGFFLAVSFSDRIRLMQIMAKDLKLFGEISIKHVQQIRFSNGGHLIAAVQSNSKLVVVYSSRNMKKLAPLRHSKDVASVSFDPDDKTLVTIGEDGRVCEWSTQTWNMAAQPTAAAGQAQVSEQTRHGEAKAVAAGPDGLAWAGVVEGDSCAFRTFKNCTFQESEDFALQPSQQLCALSLYKGTKEISVVAGDASGTLRTFCNLTGIIRTTELGLHAAGCTNVCISTDGRTVATAGSDGAIFVVRVEGLGDGAPPPTAGSLRGRAGSSMEVVMINRGEIQQRQDEIQELSQQTSALKTQLEEDAARLQSECRARVEEAGRKDQERIQSLRLKYESLQQASTAKERENLRQMKAMEALHVQTADDKEKAYDKTMRTEANRYMALEAELKDLAGKSEQVRAQAQRSLVQLQQKQEQDLRRRLSEKDNEIQKVKDLIAYTQQRFDAMLDQEGMEQGMEVADMKRKNQEELEQQHLVEYKLKKEQDTLLRGLDMMEKDRDRIAKEQREASLIVNNLKSEAEVMKRDVAVLKDERRDREATLRDKEVEIGSHKLKVQTLKKFKHVLDYRLREVTESLKPKERNIEQLHVQLGMLESEFERQLEQQKQMEKVLEQKAEQVAALMAEAEKQKEILKQRDRTILSYKADLHALATTEQDTRNWHIGLKKIWRDHVDPESFNKDEGSKLPMQELGRQIQVMENKASMLAAKGKISQDTCKADIIHKTQENALLITELDEIRVETKALQRQMKNLELQVRQGEQKLSEEAALKALPDEDSVESSKPSSRGGVSKQLPKAVQDFFEEAPIVRKQAPRGQMKKASHKSEHHKSAAEIQSVKKLMKAAESNNQRMQMQRIEQKLLQDQLDSLTKRKKTAAASGAQQLPSSTPLSTGLTSPASPAGPGPAAGGGLSAVRGIQGAPTPVSELSSPGR